MSDKYKEIINFIRALYRKDGVINLHEPVFIDVDRDTMGLSPEKLADFLEKNCDLKKDGYTYNRLTGKRIKA